MVHALQRFDQGVPAPAGRAGPGQVEAAAQFLGAPRALPDQPQPGFIAFQLSERPGQDVVHPLAADALRLRDLMQAQVLVVVELHERSLRFCQQRAVGTQQQRAFHMLLDRLHPVRSLPLRAVTCPCFPGHACA